MSAGSTLLLLQRRFTPAALLRDGFLCDPHLPGGALDIDGNDAGYLVPVAAYGDFTGNARGPAQATGLNRGVCLRHSGENYLHLPRLTGNYASTPKAAGIDGVNSLDVEFDIAANSYSGGAERNIVAMLATTGAQRKYHIQVGSNAIVVRLSADGSSLTTITSDTLPNVANFARYRGRVKWSASSGELRFFLSDNNGATFSQFGATQTTLASNLFDSTAPLDIGYQQNSSILAPFPGRIYRVIIRDGIDGPVAFDTGTAWGGHGATSFTAPTGQTVTINATGNNPAGVIGRTVVRGDGVNTFYDFPSNALGLFRNVGYGLLGAVARCLTTGSEKTVISCSNAVNTNLTIYTPSASGNRFATGGRRITANGFQFITSDVDHNTLTHQLNSEVNWSNRELRLFQNGSKVAESLTFQDGGLSEDLNAVLFRLYRVGNSSAYFSGDIGSFWGDANPAVSPKLAQLSRHYCRAYNIPYLGP